MKWIWIVWLLLAGVRANALSHIVPQNFGAIADGNNDCTEALRMMFKAMKEKGIYTVVFPKGSYLISGQVVIDFPCRIIGKEATIISKDTLRSRYAFMFSMSQKGTFVANNKRTDISLNFKVHAIPIAFHGFNNVYMHDCTISTYTSEKDYYKTTKFWFAIDCSRFYDGKFSNIRFEQPVNYKKNQFNSADGLHINGQCHDIIVDKCSGHCGDDFVALNANERTPGDIYNIRIKNCYISSDTLSKNGIRIYGASKTKQLTIKNVVIEKCTIKCDNSPCIYITNAASGLYDDKNKKLRVRNLVVRDCEFYAPRYEMKSQNHPSIIRLGGVDGDRIRFKNIKAYANKDSMTYFLNILDYNDIGELSLYRCSIEGETAKDFINVSNNVKSDTRIKGILFRHCSIVKQ